MVKTKDIIMARLMGALYDSDDLRKPQYKGHSNPLKGHCYIAAEAYYFLAGGKNSNLKSYVMRINKKETHWFLKDKKGNVIDPTAGQFNKTPDYSKGRGCGFLTKSPSKRTLKLLDRIYKQKDWRK